MIHWLVTTGALISAMAAIYAGSRRALRRATATLHTAAAVWHLPECVEALTKVVATLTAELSQIRAATQQPDPDSANHRSHLGEEWHTWRDGRR